MDRTGVEAALPSIDRLVDDVRPAVLATLIRLLRDFDVAEEATQDALLAAIEQWPSSGVPANPRAWLIQTGRFKGINVLRRRRRFEEPHADLDALGIAAADGDPVHDDLLRLVFTCCHPALAEDAQVALTLRTLCGLRTDEIARAFLVPTTTMAARLVRAKSKIRNAAIPYAVPAESELASRLQAVMTVIYLLFNAGYTAAEGDALVREDLCTEALRLGILLRRIMAARATPELAGLVALMLLHDARRATRTDADGELVLLEDQDRTLWNRAQIAEALPLVEEALRGGPTAFAIQAAVAALHARAERAADTDWAQIAALYGVLETLQPSPLVTLNRAVAVAMVAGPSDGLAIVERANADGVLDDYQWFHAARADLLRRLGENDRAAAAYRSALALAANDVERRFLERQLGLLSRKNALSVSIRERAD